MFSIDEVITAALKSYASQHKGKLGHQQTGVSYW